MILRKSINGVRILIVLLKWFAFHENSINFEDFFYFQNIKGLHFIILINKTIKI